MAKTYEKTSAVQLDDDAITAQYRKSPESGGVEVFVHVPNEDGVWVPWTDIYTSTERQTLGPLLMKSVGHRLEALGYTEV